MKTLSKIRLIYRTEVNPIVKVTVFDKSKRTDKLSTNINTHVYNEHFFFEQNNMVRILLI
jgi:hypothetical protein